MSKTTQISRRRSPACAAIRRGKQSTATGMVPSHAPRRSQTAATGRLQTAGAGGKTDAMVGASFLAGNAGRPRGLNSTPGGGLSSADLVRRSNYWRDNYNPLQGLTIARLIALFEQAERGAFAEIQLTLRKAEKRFPVLKGFIEKMVSSIGELEGKVRVKEQLPAGATRAMAERQRKFLQGRYDLLKNFKTTIAQLALADVRGYAVLQKHRYQNGVNGGAVEELYWLEPWCWVRDGFYGDFYYNENSQFGVGLGSCQAILGEDCRVGSGELPRTDFVIREAESPLYEIALIAFVNWLMGRRNYSAFVEIFGLPNAVTFMPREIPAGKEMEYQAAAEKVAQGMSGTLPYGAEVKFPTSVARNESPFESFCDAQEKDVVLAGTAGHLTMLALPTGIGKGASEEHDDAWQQIAIAKAMRINETLQRDFDAPELAAEFPSEPVCVGFALDVKDSEDVAALLDNVVKAERVGLQTDAAEISERTGMRLTRMQKQGGDEDEEMGSGNIQHSTSNAQHPITEGVVYQETLKRRKEADSKMVEQGTSPRPSPHRSRTRDAEREKRSQPLPMAKRHSCNVVYAGAERPRAGSGDRRSNPQPASASLRRGKS